MQEERAERLGSELAADETLPSIANNITRLPARQPRMGASAPARPYSERRDNLPATFASFIGRHDQIQEVIRLLEAHRLVTLAGAPGVGKTRLALQLAEQLVASYPDGVWLVELAGIFEPSAVPAAAAHSLGIREEGRAPIEALVEELRHSECLLVLDNCEHLLDASKNFAELLLMSCPRLHVLTSSRQPLGLTGEVVWRVPALTIPEPDESRSHSNNNPAILPTLLASESGQLFLERAQAARATFELSESDAAAVTEICRRVDGVPLALELAAARVAHLGPRQIAARLDDRFRLLVTGRPASVIRHSTLRALVDWSHELLSDEERTMFRRLSVFAGGWTLEATEAVCGDDALNLLGQLVDKSLVALEEHAGYVRYRFQETLRQYAEEQLDASGEAPETRRRHAQYYLAVAEDAQPRLFGVELQQLLVQLEREHDNIDRALAWCSDAGDLEVGLRLAGALWRFWQVRGYLHEGRTWLERLLAVEGASGPSIGRGRALHALGFLSFLQGDYESARLLLRDSVTIQRMLGDKQGTVESLSNLGLVLRVLNDGTEAKELFSEAVALSRAMKDRAWEGRTLNKLGRLLFYERDYDAARATHQDGLAMVRDSGNTWDVAIALGDLADVDFAAGDRSASRRHYGESLALWRELRDERGVAQALEGFAVLDFAEARPERAVRVMAAAAAIRERVTEPSSPSRRAALAKLLDNARSELGETYETIWQAGHGEPLEPLVKEVLQASAAAEERESMSDTNLSAREHDVVTRIARGLTNKQIAQELVVSERTVEWHVSNVLGRLDLSSRSQLALWAHERGLNT